VNGGIFQLLSLATKLIHQPDELAGVSIAVPWDGLPPANQDPEKRKGLKGVGASQMVFPLHIRFEFRNPRLAPSGSLTPKWVELGVSREALVPMSKLTGDQGAAMHSTGENSPA